MTDDGREGEATVALREVRAVRVDAECLEPYPSRWGPVDLVCEDDGQAPTFRTKLIQDPDSAAMGVSEAVSHQVLKVVGLHVADAAAVVVEPNLADSLRRQFSLSKPVLPGLHWSTRLLTSSAAGVQYTAKTSDLLSEPLEVFTLFLADTILANEDRCTFGNVLLQSDKSKAGRSHLIPIDQSDCFKHPTVLRDMNALMASKDATIANYLPGTEAIVFDRVDAALDEFERLRAMKDQIVSAATAAPDSWYTISNVTPTDIATFLSYRVDHLDRLGIRDHWGGMQLFKGEQYVLIQ